MKIEFIIMDGTKKIESGFYDLDVYESRAAFAVKAGRYLREGFTVITMKV